MAIDLRSSSPSTASLAVQISETERRLRSQRRLVGVRGTTLGRTLHRRMTAPTTLLLAGGLGFLMGELAQRQTLQLRGADRLPDSGHPFFETVLNLIKLVNWGHTVFTVLPGAETPPREPSIPSR